MFVGTVAALLALLPTAFAAVNIAPALAAVPAASIVSSAADSVPRPNVTEIGRQTASSTSIGTTCGCFFLELLFPKNTFKTGDTAYTAESTEYWDLRENLEPSCVFVPSNNLMLATGVVTLEGCQSKFAVRGGGHMPVKGAANIADGVLIAMTNFNQVTISADQSSVTFGSGIGWYPVYAALEKYGLYVIGGRLKSIGVAGLTLGGGLNYLAAKYGLTMDNVIKYQVVLSSGLVVSASKSTNADLFRALKGGNNNFGIVTAFTMTTYKIPSFGTGLISFPGTSIPALISAVCNTALYQEHYQLDAGVIPTLDYVPSTGAASESSLLFTVAVGTTATPPVFANYTAIPRQFALLNVSTPAYWHSTWDTPFQTQRRIFASKAVLPDAANVEIMWNLLKTASASVANVPGLTTSMTLQPIPKSATAVGNKNGIGSAFQPSDAQASIWWTIQTFWENAADDAQVTAWQQKTAEAIHAANVAKKLALPIIYTGDAGDWQDPIAAYPAANIAKMKTVQAKYDPALTWQKLTPGGFKLKA